MKKEKLLLGYLFFISINAFAQGDQPAMADLMRSNGKIYVVVAIVMAIFIGIALYLFRIDRKVKSIEDHLDSK